MQENNRILVIKLQSYNSLSSSNMRMLAMMKGLDELGYKMDLLCTPLSSANTLNDMRDYSFLERVTVVTTEQNKAYESLVSVSKVKKKSIKQAMLPYLRRIYHRLSLYTGSAGVARRLKLSILPHNDYKYVISVSDPKISQIALLSLVKQGIKSGKIIEYWGDPLSGDITQKAIYPEFIIKHEERKYLSIADKIVYTSPFTLEMEQNNYPQFAQKMTFVPTANAFEKVYPETRNEIYTVGYYGAYYSSIRNIIPLYESFKQLEGKAQLYLVGDSDLTLESTANVEIRPRGVVRDLEERTDLFVCVLNSSGTQIPGKLYHNAATNRPILVILDGDQQDKMRDYLNSFDRFVFCNNKTSEIVETILKISKDRTCWNPCKLLSPKLIAERIIN